MPPRDPDKPETSLIRSVPDRPSGRRFILDVDVSKANTLHLILLVPAGLLKALMKRIPLRVRRFLLSFFGVCAMVSPLLLWLAATKFLLVTLLGFALTSIVICWAIVMFSPEDQI